jgi:hypothetical protein
LYKYTAATPQTPGVETLEDTASSTSNGLVFGQRFANPVMGFSGETAGANAIVQVLRYGSLLPEGMIAFRAATGQNEAGYLRAQKDKRTKRARFVNWF